MNSNVSTSSNNRSSLTDLETSSNHKKSPLHEVLIVEDIEDIISFHNEINQSDNVRKLVESSDFLELRNNMHENPATRTCHWLPRSSKGSIDIYDLIEDVSEIPNSTYVIPVPQIKIH